MNDKYKCLLTNSKTLNVKFLTSKKFLNSSLYNDLLKDTECLNIFNDISINDRASFLIHDMKLSKCKICGRPYFIINQNRHKLCNHHQVLKKRKIYGKDRDVEIMEYLKNTNFNNIEITNVNFKKLKTLNSLKYIFHSDLNTFNFVIKETLNILPNLDADLNERLYIFKNNIKECPICKHCGKKLLFLNKNIGYAKCYCTGLIQERKIQLIEDLFKNNKDFIWKNKEKFLGLNKTPIIFTHKKCGLDSEVWLMNGRLLHTSNLRCEHCNPISSGQYELESFIKSLGVSFKQNFRPENKLEGDIFIEDNNLIIEYNCSYWHREDKLGKNYHLKKLNYFLNLGYKIINIWEYDWINPFKQNILKEKIKAILGINQTKIYARKCEIKEIENNVKNNFLNLNHIQGEDKSKIKLGLFYNDELVAVMTFGKPRFNKKYEYELIRYATKSGCHVLGGAGKLLKYFELNYKPKSIITYADRSYSQGNMYRKIGFTELKPSAPGYVWTNGVTVLSRYECQKHKLVKLLGDKFDNNLSESENMKKNKFYKVYDCGNLVFQKVPLQ